MTAAYETNSETKSSARNLTRSVLLVALIFTSLSLGSASANATTTAKSFAFGPGTPLASGSQASVSLNVPARTSVKVSGVLNPVSGLPVTVVIDVLRPSGGSAASLTLITPVGGLPGLPFIFPVEAITGFSSQVGCPSPWKVRVKTINGATPGVGVSGGITFDYQRPDTVNLDMVGDSISVEKNDTENVELSGHGTLGIANGTLIAGTGEFRIKAKWDTDDLWYWRDHFKVTVKLKKPNGQIADFEKRYSQTNDHVGSSSRLDFRYTVTPADAALTGTWKLKIIGNSTVNIKSFDIENFAFPGFNSTFHAECN
jgi:hypothetical protein